MKPKTYRKFKETTFSEYLRLSKFFSFAGCDIVVHIDRNGIDAVEAFFEMESNGKLLPTKHPNIFKRLLNCKASVNLHIRMYAEDRAKGYLPKKVFQGMITEMNLPSWFINAVEIQKCNFY